MVQDASRVARPGIDILKWQEVVVDQPADVRGRNDNGNR
jgi:hypothetical protein